MATLPELLQTLVENSGSDLHITTDSPPTIRVHGHMKRLDLPPLGPADTKALAYSVLTDQQKKRTASFPRRGKAATAATTRATRAASVSTR